MDPSIAQSLASVPWYHGLLPREDMRALLLNNGDFLLRMSEPAVPGKREFVLSVMWDKDIEKGIKHFVIQQLDGKFGIDKNQTFNSILDLVKHYMTTKQSISPQVHVALVKPVGRRPWQLDHADIVCTKKLGEGAFGEVHKGVLTRKGRKREKVDVAIKQAKLDNMTKEQLKEFMREARLMRHFEHPNVVRMYGVAAGEEPLMLVMELASNGALDSYLKKTECTLATKMEMCLQSAWGLEYLHDQGVMHRDIASRNCLYGDGKVKISDFGLSRQATIYMMNPKCRVPIRWLAPETLRTAMYSQKTDVWSFGIMCWEIFHNGAEPYPGMTVAEMNVQVKEGYRMPLNDLSLPQEMITLIENRCWSDSPNDRYTMGDLAKSLERITKCTRPDFSARRSKTKTTCHPTTAKTSTPHPAPSHNS